MIILIMIQIANNLMVVKFLLPANNLSNICNPTIPAIHIDKAIIINIGVNNV